MNNMRFRQTISCVFLSGILFLTACQKETSGQPVVPPNAGGGQTTSAVSSKDLLPLVPGIRERNIVRLYMHRLEADHLLQRPLDDAVSKEALRLYIRSLDVAKVYFYQSDIDEFRQKYETKICDLARNRDASPAFEIYNRFIDRIKERVDMIVQILATTPDFTLDEEIVRDKSKDFTLDPAIIEEKGLQSWPNTPDEAYELWRKRIKAGLLDLKAEARSKAKEREKALAEGKELPKQTEDRDPVERLQKQYTSFRKRMMLENHIEDGKILDDIKREANDDVLELYLSAISGALDPHTSYMSASTSENFELMMEKSLEGIGASLAPEDGYTTIKKLTKGGPAEKSGLLNVEDQIVGVGQGVDGKIEDVIDLGITDVVKQIRGPKGSTVRLEVKPADGGANRIVEIVRDKIELDDQAALGEVFTVGQKPDGNPYKIGVIELPDFYADMNALRRGDFNARSTTGDVGKFLQQFVSENVDAVVLDLRDNGGGLLTEAISLTGLFFETANVVQTKEGAGTRAQQDDDRNPGCDWTGPLVVVTNRFSASASEIFAGAIKDYKRGLIVGDSHTHGKGTVQQLRDLNEMLVGRPDGKLGDIKITIKGFYSPRGVSPQREGVAADVVIPSFWGVYEGIGESDLDNALTLEPISAAKNFPKTTPYVTAPIVAELQKRSNERIKTVEGFKEVEKDIAAYLETRDRKSTTLNEKKFFEEQDRLNADRKEQKKLADILENEGKIEKDYYLDEVLNLSIDYLGLLQRNGIAFPKERTIQRKNSPLNFLFGR